jgi:hypothetical protein
MEDHPLQPILFRPIDFILEKPMEATHFDNLFIKQLVEETHYDNLFNEKLVWMNYFGNLFIEDQFRLTLEV